MDAAINGAYNHATKQFAVRLSHSALPYGKAKPCFFLERELGHTAETLRAAGWYRHLTKYGTGYFDYISKNEYSTIQEWVADCNSSMDKVLFGFNKFDGRKSYITLQEFLTQIGAPAPAPLEDTLDLLVHNMRIDDLTVDNLVVITPKAIMPGATYMKTHAE
jgi:hypothetical protein